LYDAGTYDRMKSGPGAGKQNTCVVKSSVGHQTVPGVIAPLLSPPSEEALVW